MKQNVAKFRALIEKFSEAKVLVLGDLMVDRFVRGKVSRISPEAPVPVVRVREESDIPGGAGNVIMNLAALGGKVSSCGVIGEDSTGQKLAAQFKKVGVCTDGILQDAQRSTTLKTRVIAEHQQVVRFDYESTDVVPRALQVQMLDYLKETIPQMDAIVLSDYGKGVVVNPILTQAIAIAKKYKKPVTVDPKVEHFLSYKNVTCITPNLLEATGGMHRVGVKNEDAIRKLGADILKKLRSESVLITRGEDGMTLFEKNKITHISTKAQEIYDVTGAGDTVISVLTLCLACGASLADSAILANLAASIVVAKLGTATVTPGELTEALKRL